MEQPGVIAGNFESEFSLNFLSIFVHISGSLGPITLIGASLERSFPPAEVELSEEEEEIFWKSEKLGGKTPESLTHTVRWLLTQQFGLRGRQEHHGMRLEDFRIMKGDDGLEFAEFAEMPTKTRPGGLKAKPRQFQPKMFQTGGERCSVVLFRQYISRRPPNLRTSGPGILSLDKTQQRI